MSHYSSNCILANVTADEMAQFAPHLRLQSLRKNQVLFKRGEAISHIHVPVGAIVSMSMQLADGFAAETQMLGKSGVVGVGGFANQASFCTATVTEAGLSYQVSFDAFQAQYAKGGKLMQAVLSHVRFAASELQQSIVCSKHHSLTQQLAKWLLNMHDNNDGGVLDFSHQEIAHLLGFRREGVTVALGLLEAAQLISMKSKQIALLNHRALEDVACECYHEMRKHDPCALH